MRDRASVMRIGAVLGAVLVVMGGAACGSGPLCENGTAEGSVWIRSDDDLRAMVGCVRVKGHVVIDTLNSATLAGLESLTTIDGKLIIGQSNETLSDISALANLASVGGGNVQGGNELIVTGNRQLTTVRFPALTSLGGQLGLGGPGLTTLGFPALTSIPGGLFVNNTTALTSLAGLETVTSIGGNLVVQGNAVLPGTAGLAGLTNVAADVLVVENPALVTLSLPALASVGATGQSPTGIGPSSRQLYVASNPMLTQIDVPALTFVGAGGVRIYNNVALPQCQADAVATRAGTVCDCSGNDGLAACP